MLQVAKIIGLIWVAMILTYGLVTIAIGGIQGSFRFIKRALWSKTKWAAK
jgi:hypothetical protein